MRASIPQRDGLGRSAPGIIAVVYDQPDDEVRRFLAAIDAQRGGPYSVWVVVTNPERRLANLPSRVTVIHLDENVGWTGGVNRGAELAIEAGYDDLIVMNTDIHVLTADLFERLTGALRSEPNIGFVSPTITTFPDTSKIWYQGAVFSPTTWITRHPGIGTQLTPSGRLLETGHPSGCCVAMRGHVFAELGGFDEALFAYFDEADLAYRARAIGWRAAVLDDPLLAHEHSGRALTTVSAYYFGRNPLLLARKNSGPMKAMVAAGAHIMASAYYIARCASADARRAYFRGLLHGFAHLLGHPHTGKGH